MKTIPKLGLARLLAAEKDRRDLTQVEFCKLLGISQGHLSSLLSGRTKRLVRFGVIAKIAELTGRSIEEVGKMANGDGKR